MSEVNIHYMREHDVKVFGNYDNAWVNSQLKLLAGKQRSGSLKIMFQAAVKDDIDFAEVLNDLARNCA